MPSCYMLVKNTLYLTSLSNEYDSRTSMLLLYT